MTDQKYLGVAVSVKGTIFTHPCDGSPAADAAAKGRGDYPYTHLYEGDDVRAVMGEMETELWDAQLHEWPGSVRLTPVEVFAWCDEAPTTEGRLGRYMQVSMAIQYPYYVFYRIEGTDYRGFRFGTSGSEYMSMYSHQ